MAKARRQSNESISALPTSLFLGMKAVKNNGSHTSTSNFQDITSWVALQEISEGSFNLTTGEYTFGSNGRFLVVAKIGFQANGTGSRGIVIYNNESPVDGSTTLIPAGGNTGLSALVVMPIQGVLGQKLLIKGYQSSGGNLAYETNVDAQTFLSIMKISN